jgi:hypothetical protein
MAYHGIEHQQSAGENQLSAEKWQYVAAKSAEKL